MIESQIKMEYVDKAIWTVRITDISDIEYAIVYELISAEPPTEITSITHTIRLTKVTDENHTLFLWST